MSRPGGWSVAAASFLAVAVPAAQAAASATFTLTITDAAGVGFNDLTPASPVGGNTGTTVGEQRRLVFQRAIQLWGNAISSTVPIEVTSSFAPLACSGGSAILGQAKATKLIANATGLPAGKWYPIALANAITGRDLAPTEADIQATFNGDLSCLNVDWYYGFDGNRGDKVDLLHTLLHELTHGLGFSDSTSLTTGELGSGLPSIYGTFLFDDTVQLGWTSMSNAQRLASITDVRKLVWTGNNVKTTAATYLAKGAPSLTLSPAVTGFSGFVTEANYGPFAAAGTVTGVVAHATGNSSCGMSGVSLSGKIVLVAHTAYCSPIGTANWVQNQGGIAAIIAYTQSAGSPPPLLIDAKATQLASYTINIPTVAITAADAALLLGSGVTETATISGDSSQLVGADPAGRTMMYAADPVKAGSSLSHWDPLVRPDLVLQPVSPAIPVHDITMERALMLDLGWPAGAGSGGSSGSGGSGAGGASGSGGSGSGGAGAGGMSGSGGKGSGGSGAGGVSGSGGKGSGGSGAGGVSGSGGKGAGGSGAGGVGGSGGTGSGGRTADAGVDGTTTKDAGDGCGCAAGRPSGTSAAAWLLALAVLMRRPRRRA